MPIKILLVDDHEVVRTGLKTILATQPDFVVVGEAADGQEAVDLAIQLAPDVVLTDVSMPNMDGIQATRLLKAQLPNVKVIALTIRMDRLCLDSMLMAGACGFLSKSSPTDEIARAIRSVMDGKTYLTPDAAQVFMTGYLGTARNEERRNVDLTPEESDVLKRLANGKSPKEIAAELSLSLKTVESRRRKLMDKLGAKSLAELVKYAIRKGLTELDA